MCWTHFHSWSQNDVILSWLRLTAPSNCVPHPYWTYTKWLSKFICYPWACSSRLTQLYPHYLGQILGYWVTCGVKMMSLFHGWGWQPPQTASHIHIRHLQSVWAHWYAVHWHTVAALHSFTHPTWLRIWGRWSLMVSKWCILSRLILTATSNCFPHPYWTYTTWLSILICYPWACSIIFTQLYPPYLAQILGLWVTCGVKIMWLCHGWGSQPPQTASHIHERH